MDNAGDWLYIVFLIIAGISSLFGSKNKKKRPKQILGQPDREKRNNNKLQTPHHFLPPKK